MSERDTEDVSSTDTNDSWLVEYAGGEEDSAKWLANNRFMSVDETRDGNVLAVSGAEEPINLLTKHDCILSVEQEDEK